MRSALGPPGAAPREGIIGPGDLSHSGDQTGTTVLSFHSKMAQKRGIVQHQINGKHSKNLSIVVVFSLGFAKV